MKWNLETIPNQLFHDGGPYHIETSPLTCGANQWTGFYIIGISVLKDTGFYIIGTSVLKDFSVIFGSYYFSRPQSVINSVG